MVGGGNSAGQAAVYLSTAAAKVHMLVRGPGLAETDVALSSVDRIAAAPNIELHTRTELSGLVGPPAALSACG